MTEDQIVAEITRRAWRFGVSVLLAPGESIDMDGHAVSGYFDGDERNPQLRVAWGAPRHLGTLLHEYSHLTQWVEDAPVWRCDLGGWDEWVHGKTVPDIRRRIEGTREVEADCERRTLRLIRELDAPIDLEQYARGANAYVHFYNVIADTRKWYAPSRRPYNIPSVLAAANPTLDRDFSKTPKALRNALLECVQA